jgi:nucleotide-binding universal stress UspA family protein
MLKGTSQRGIQNILVPTDMSPASAVALEYAVGIAQQMKAQLTVYHGFNYLAGLDADEYPKELKPMIDKQVAELNEKLNLFVMPYKNGEVEMPIRTVVKQGLITNEISKVTETEYDLVIIGTKGASGVDEVVFGSVASSVVEVANCPVLVIPAQAKVSTIRNIAYGVNFEPIDEEVIAELVEWSSYLGSVIECIHINTNGNKSAEKQEKMQKLAEKYKNKTALHFELIEDYSVTDGIELYIHSRKPDIMAVLRKERSFIEKLFHTSVSNNLTFHSKIPVLILKMK